jgi:hypothetical protein
MKAKIAILVLLSAAPWVDAASTVPKLMSYQGRVTDSAGVAIGSTAAVNRTVTFSLYASPSGDSDLSYRETQTVTISGGEFSVLIGNGTGVSGYPGPTSPASSIKTLDGVINSAATSALYLGITVDDGNSATQDTEISPRQQLVTGAFAVRALMAESVASGAVTSTMLGNSSVGTNQVATSAINSAKILDGTIAGTDIAGSTITRDKINTTSIGLWEVSDNNIYRATNVGIGVMNVNGVVTGVTNPVAVLELSAKTGTTTPANNGLRVVNYTNTTGNNAVLAAAVAGSSAGSPFVSLDISGVGGWSIGTDNADLDKLVFKNSWDFVNNPKMAIDTAGNVGIGTTSPSEKLMVSGGSLRVASTSNPYLAVASVNSSSVTINQATLGVATSAGSGSSSAAANDAILKSDSAKLILQSGIGAAGIVIDTANKVGIGTSTPTEKLTIQDGKLWFNSTTSDNGGIGGTMASNDQFRIFGSGTSDAGALYIDTYDGANEPIIFRQVNGAPTAAQTPYERMRVAANGYLGVGTTAPLAPLHVAGSTSLTVNQQGYFDWTGGHDSNNQSHVDNYGIYCDNRIVALAFDATSDSRIKTDLLVTDNAADLKVLQGIQITDYYFKDSLMNGNRPQKKVIAQQVEAVFPQAVTQKPGIIPDILSGAKTKDGWVTLVTDLKVGDKVRLLADKESHVREVLEVRVGAFRTAFISKGAEVFVYGREVDDLRSVDYDAIAMLNVSATQELAKKLEQKDVELEQKDAVIAALEARMSALEKRVFGAK